MYTCSSCCGCWVTCVITFGYHQRRWIVILFYETWQNDDFFVIWMAYTTLMNVFYCSRGSTYFPVHADGHIYAYLRDFGHCWVCLDMAIICITTLSYMWILIDMIDGLSGLSYDPWYQKHGLYAHTVDREQIIPSYPPLPIPDITFYDQCISNDVNHILYCSWCCDKSLGITRAPRSSSWYVWP